MPNRSRRRARVPSIDENAGRALHQKPHRSAARDHWL